MSTHNIQSIRGHQNRDWIIFIRVLITKFYKLFLKFKKLNYMSNIKISQDYNTR